MDDGWSDLVECGMTYRIEISRRLDRLEGYDPNAVTLPCTFSKKRLFFFPVMPRLGFIYKQIFRQPPYMEAGDWNDFLERTMTSPKAHNRRRDSNCAAWVLCSWVWYSPTLALDLRLHSFLTTKSPTTKVVLIHLRQLSAPSLNPRW